MKNFIEYLLHSMKNFYFIGGVCDVSIQNSIDSFLNEFELFLSKQKITVTAAAEEIGVTRSHLSKVIHKRTSPSVELLEKMDSFLKQGEY